MSIAYDTMPPRHPRRASSAPTASSLLNRIQKPPLLDRLSKDDASLRPTPSGPYVPFSVPALFSLPSSQLPLFPTYADLPPASAIYLFLSCMHAN